MTEVNWNLLGSIGKSYNDAYSAAKEDALNDQLRNTLAGVGDTIASNDPDAYNKAGQALIRGGRLAEGLSVMELGRKKAAGEKFDAAFGNLSGAGSGAGGSPQTIPEGDASKIHNEFMSTVAGSGLTNPNAQAALAAYGLHESKFAPANVNREWSDPSESGAPGTSGGILSWRNDRLQNLYKFAATRGEQPGNISPTTQALFFKAEDPERFAALQAAPTPEAAHDIMRNAWGFAGYNRPGGENAARLATTRAYLARLQGAPIQPVAETDEDIARLEQEHNNTPASLKAALRPVTGPGAPLALNPLNPPPTPAEPARVASAAPAALPVGGLGGAIPGATAPIVPAGQTPLAMAAPTDDAAGLFTPPASAPTGALPVVAPAGVPTAAPAAAASPAKPADDESDDEETPAAPATGPAAKPAASAAAPAAPAQPTREQAVRQEKINRLTAMIAIAPDEQRRAAAKALLDVELARQKNDEQLTDNQRNFRQAQSEGYKGTFTQWLDRNQDKGKDGAETDAKKRAGREAFAKARGWDVNGPNVAQFIASANGKLPGPPELVGQTAPDPSLTGDDFLSTLPPSRAEQIKAIADGRMGPTMIPAKERGPVMRDLAQYEPGFDLTTWNARAATRKDFASGKMAQNIAAMNTAMGHISDLSRAADALNNSSFTPYNTVTNYVATKTGDPRVKNFQIARDAVASELRKVFGGTSGGSLRELQEWQNSIDAADSPAQLQGVVAKAVDLLKSRLDAVGDQYSRGMGKATDPMTLLSPKAQAALQRLGSGEATTEAAPAAPTVPTPAAPRSGSIPIPGDAVRELQAAPDKDAARAEFDAAFGAGASDRILGPRR